MVMTGEPGG
jgi:hypothetical protein